MKYFFFLVRLLSDTQFISRCVCSFFFFFLPQRSRQEVIYSPQLFNHPTDTTGVTVRGAERMPPGEEPLQILHSVTCPEGCEPQVLGWGSRVAISYLCVAYQSRLQSEKAITEFKPLAFVHSHSSLTNTHQTSRPALPDTHSLRLCSCCEECVERQKEKEVLLWWHQQSEGDLRGTAACFWERRSFHTHRGSFSPVLRGPWLRAHKELLISSEHIKKLKKKIAFWGCLRRQYWFHRRRNSLNVGCLCGLVWEATCQKLIPSFSLLTLPMREICPELF